MPSVIENNVHGLMWDSQSATAVSRTNFTREEEAQKASIQRYWRRGGPLSFGRWTTDASFAGGIRGEDWERRWWEEWVIAGRGKSNVGVCVLMSCLSLNLCVVAMLSRE